MTFHVVGFSGGIDSQACALWVRQRFPADQVLLLFSDTGWEDPITYEFVQGYSRNVFPVTTVTPLVGDDPKFASKERAGIERAGLAAGDELTMERLAVIKGRFASTQSAFCTAQLKLWPQRRWLAENVPPPDDYERYTGVRRDEGGTTGRRAQTPEAEFDEFFDCTRNNPLAFWTKERCFEFVTQAGEEYNPLYRMGHSRVGCSPCHQRGKLDIRIWAAGRPDEVEKVRGAEQRTKRTFFPPMVPGLAINWIDDVIAWSRTSHGGRVTELPILEAEVAHGSCMSRYGLCE